MAPAALAMLALFGYPVVKNLMMSLQDYGLRTFFTGQAPWVGLRNYSAVVNDQLFSQAMVNTALFTIGSIAFQFTVGLGLALFFRRPVPAQRFAAVAAPAAVAAAADRVERDLALHPRAGQRDPEPEPDLARCHRRSGAVAELAVGGADRGDRGEHLDRHPVQRHPAVLRSGEIPDELYEAGQLDGATGWQAFRYITWPNLRAVASVLLVLGVVYTIKVLDIILGLTGGGPANATQTLATQSYERSFIDFKFGEGAALSNILIAISLLFAVLYLRATRRAIDE